MQYVTPQCAVALYCCPALDDLDCERRPPALLAHAGRLGHAVDGVHCEEHVDGDAARGAVLDLARTGQRDLVLVPRLPQRAIAAWLRVNRNLVGSILARTQGLP